MNECKYCDLKNYGTYVFDYKIVLHIQDGAWNTLYMAYDKNRKEYSIMAVGDGSAEIKIDYCPFCGRKLGGEDE